MKKSATLYSIKFILVGLVLAISFSALGFFFTKHLENSQDKAQPTFLPDDGYTIVIDAGHGGEDPGAVGSDGTLEKDLNLEISTLIYALCELNGNNAILTRCDDKLLYDYYDDLEDYTGHKKVYDLKNRLKITESQRNPIYVGIHMNKFQESKYSGLQVYYSKHNEKSSSLASDISKRTKEFLQPYNKRQPKVAGSGIYILDNLECPSVLIECGFMSNESELEALKNEEYRKRLAICIFSSLISLD
ncbi:MAG: N-acetylmuramoyl-L-alanine amidase [Clostridia bacterium]|nr:N-acetylmuramoyl-L-alanine amidase [Clostridia bacterium]